MRIRTGHLKNAVAVLTATNIKVKGEEMMNKFVGVWVFGTLGLMLVGGCATENVVKKDDTVFPPATAQTKQADVKSVKNGPDSTAIAATPAKQDKENVANGATKPAAQGMEQMKSALDKIYFDFDSYTLSDKSRATLANSADYLKKHPEASIRIEGNCDERGSAEYNIALGEKRAKAAMKYFSTMGIAENHLTTISYGKEKPVEPGHDEASWAKNRRDDFIVLSK